MEMENGVGWSGSIISPDELPTAPVEGFAGAVPDTPNSIRVRSILRLQLGLYLDSTLV